MSSTNSQDISGESVKPFSQDSGQMWEAAKPADWNLH